MSLLVGCGAGGPALGTVTGTVTVDGAPLASAKLEFQPQGEGSPSYGMTDAQGRYELRYSADRPGAMVGRHVVRITTYRQKSSGPDTPERLPAWCHSETKLAREVTPGANQIDFTLDTKNPPSP